MKLFGVIIDEKLIAQVFMKAFSGYLMGLGIRFINLFDGSENAPLICAMAGGLYSFGRAFR